jgi:hypothetical protein
MKKYKCDICQGLDELTENGYFGYNSTYGYCDDPACKVKAESNLRADIQEQIDAGRPDIAQEILGDECLSEYIM